LSHGLGVGRRVGIAETWRPDEPELIGLFVLPKGYQLFSGFVALAHGAYSFGDDLAQPLPEGYDIDPVPSPSFLQGKAAAFSPSTGLQRIGAIKIGVANESRLFCTNI